NRLKQQAQCALITSLLFCNIYTRDHPTIRRTLNNHGVHGASKKNIAASLQFAKDHADKPEGYWRNVLWTDVTKIELFGLNEQRYV
uniref:Transposase Tc1-like domain-containing protein n=1 Tax=Sinocyclocheilus anshuiensis TaxID=1608454 RepID=A0A671PJD3_9TELE